MTVSNYSTTASSNTSVNGINISEGMSPSDVNNAQRSILSDTRSVWNDKEWIAVIVIIAKSTAAVDISLQGRVIFCN